MASAFFEKIGSMAKNVTDKANDALKINRINAKINGEYQKISGLKMQLGEYIWTRFEAGDSFDENVLDICSQIKECEDNTRTFEEEILKIKNVAYGLSDTLVNICSACGNPVGSNLNFCPKCGTRLTTVPIAPVSSEPQNQFCPNCGKELTEDQKFCGACGTKVE